jgi:hypothetical protein
MEATRDDGTVSCSATVIVEDDVSVYHQVQLYELHPDTQGGYTVELTNRIGPS